MTTGSQANDAASMPLSDRGWRTLALNGLMFLVLVNGALAVYAFREIGFLRAAKERSAREYGQQIARVLALIGSLGKLMMPIDLQQKIAATLVTRRKCAISPLSLGHGRALSLPMPHS